MLHGQEDRLHIDRHHMVPLRLGALFQRLDQDDPSIIDQMVQRAIRFQDGANGSLNILLFRDIAGQQQRFTARASNMVQRLAALLFIEFQQPDLRTLFGEHLRNALPNTGTSAGNQRDTAI